MKGKSAMVAFLEKWFVNLAIGWNYEGSFVLVFTEEMPLDKLEEDQRGGYEWEGKTLNVANGHCRCAFLMLNFYLGTGNILSKFAVKTANPSG